MTTPIEKLNTIYNDSYSHVPYDTFVRKYHEKFYSHVPLEVFTDKLGITVSPEPPPPPEQPTSGFIGGDVPLMEHTPRESWENARTIGPMATAPLYGVPYVGPALAGAASMAIGRTADYLYGEDTGIGPGMELARNIAFGYALKPIEYAGRFGRTAYKALKGGAAEAETLYQGALKPSTVLKRGEVKERIKTALDEGITVSDKGLDMVRERITGLNKEISGVIDSVKYSGKIQKKVLIDNLKKLQYKYANSEDIGEYSDAIEKYIERFSSAHGEEISIHQAQSMKKFIYRQIRKSYEMAKRVGMMSNQEAAVVQARRNIASSIREEIENIVPEIRMLNDRERKLIGLQDSLERAVGRIKNWDVIGLSEPLIGIMIGGGSSAKRWAAMLAARYLKEPEVRSKIALRLSKLRGPISETTKELLALPPGPISLGGKTPQSYVRGVPAELAERVTPDTSGFTYGLAQPGGMLSETPEIARGVIPLAENPTIPLGPYFRNLTSGPSEPFASIPKGSASYPRAVSSKVDAMLESVRRGNMTRREAITDLKRFADQELALGRHYDASVFLNALQRLKQ